MKFNQLEIEMFLSVKEKIVVPLADKGLVLVQGRNEDADAFDSNGAGKSTAYSDALMWVLYGETTRGYKGDDIVNRFVGKNTKVKLSMEDNGDQYEIVRFRKHKDFKNAVLLIRNGKNITPKSDTDTNAAIVDLLQMDYSSATNSFVFGQGISKMFASSTDSDQKKILERMLQIDILRSCQTKAKEKLDSLENSKKSIESEVTVAVNKKQSLDKTVEDLQEQQDSLEKQIDLKVAELGLKKEETNRELEMVVNTDKLSQEIESLVLDIDKLDLEISKTDAYVASRDDLLSESAVLTKEVTTLDRALRIKNASLDDIKSGKNIPTVCKACGQSIPRKDTSHLEAHLAKEIQEIEDGISGKRQEMADIGVLLKKINSILEGREELTSKKEGLNKHITTLESNIRVAKSERKHLVDMIETLDKEISHQESRRGTTFVDLIEKNIAESIATSQEIKALNSKLDEIGDSIKKYNFWVNGFGNQGVKSVLLDSVTPFLNKQANWYLSRLSDDSIEVKFSTQTKLKTGESRDKFTVEVTNKNGDDGYKGNSNGEKRRIDLAINMALQDLVGSRSNKRIDFIVYDEAFEGLDAIGCERLIEVLEEKAKKFGTIFVITHNESLKELFKKSVTVVKSNRTTKILEGCD